MKEYLIELVRSTQNPLQARNLLQPIIPRGYAKGRDLYDLLWYLSDPEWPQPNLALLTNALSQTGWQGSLPTSENWRSLIYDRLKALDWKTALADVRPFLEKPGEIELLTLENLSRLLLNAPPR